MAITRSAKKALRTSLRKRVFNQAKKNNVTKALKGLKRAIAAGNKKEAQTLLVSVQKALDKAVKTHALDKNTASRRKSRFSRLVKKLG